MNDNGNNNKMGHLVTKTAVQTVVIIVVSLLVTAAGIGLTVMVMGK